MTKSVLTAVTLMITPMTMPARLSFMYSGVWCGRRSVCWDAIVEFDGRLAKDGLC